MFDDRRPETECRNGRLVHKCTLLAAKYVHRRVHKCTLLAAKYAANIEEDVLPPPNRCLRCCQKATTARRIASLFFKARAAELLHDQNWTHN